MMFTRRRYLFITIGFILVLCLSAQKKKEIKKYRIKTATSTKTLGNKQLKDEKLTFNADGLLTEEIKYNEVGEFVSVTRYKYNAEAEVTEESEFDENNVLIEKRTTKYNLLSQKIEERVTDKNGKQVKRFTYAYDAKGLRTEKKTYDGKNNLSVTKKIVYGYK